MATKSITFDHIHINVNNLEEFKSFLIDSLDGRFIKKFKVNGKEIHQVEISDVNFFLSPTEDNTDSEIHHIGLLTSNISETASRFAENNWHLIKEQQNENKKLLHYKDHHNLIIELLEK